MFSKISSLLSRVALGFCFLGFGTWEIYDPSHWLSYLPSFVPHVVAPEIMIRAHGVILTVTALGVLSGIGLLFWSALGAVMLAQIVAGLVIDTGWNDVVIRDIALFIFSLSIFTEAWARRKQ